MRPISDLQRRVEPFQVISDYVPAGDQPAAIIFYKEVGDLDALLSRCLRGDATFDFRDVHSALTKTCDSVL